MRGSIVLGFVLTHLHRTGARLALVTALVAAVTVASHAKLGSAPTQPAVRAAVRPRSAAAVTAAARLQQESQRSWEIHWCRKSGLPRELRGGKVTGAGSSVGENARQFLRQHAALFGLSTGAPDQIHQQVIPGGTLITFEQQVDGIPVLDGRIGVVVSDVGEIVHVSSSAVSVETIPSPPRLSADEALDLARQAVGLPLLRLNSPSRRVIAADASPRPAYEFYLSFDAGYPEPWRIVVDALTGEMILSQRLVLHATGSGRVFDPNPVCTMADVSLRDHGDSNSAVPVAAYYDVTLERLNPPVGGLYQLSGQFAHMQNVHIPTNIPPTSPTGAFAFYRFDNGFEEVMAFHAIDQSQAYIQSLGFTTVNNRPQVIDAHGYFNQDNSRYVAEPLGAGYLEFGDGGVDDAEDADIILHEYGHALQDNSAPGVYMGNANNGYGNETGAMGEGFCDFWAAASGLEASLASGFPAAWVGEWDAAGYSPTPQLYLRTVDSEKTYPVDMVGQVHTDGEIWSAALWVLLDRIGRDAASQVVLLSHFLVPANPDFLDGANALLAADALLSPTEAAPSGPIVGAHYNDICETMSDRGILTCSTICNCEFHADPYPDGAIDIMDVALVIDEAFFATSEPVHDPLCPHLSRSDYNCDDILDVLDISHAVDYVLRGGAKPCEPCGE